MQTRSHEHPAIFAATHGQWLDFAREELEHRKRGGFPPFSRVVMLRAIGQDESDVARAMLYCKRILENKKYIELLGPSPCAVVKIRNRIRYQLLVRTAKTSDPTGAVLRGSVRNLFEEHGNSDELRRVQWEVDVDPANTA